jgi:hypothetical protein
MAEARAPMLTRVKTTSCSSLPKDSGRRQPDSTAPIARLGRRHALHTSDVNSRSVVEMWRKGLSGINPTAGSYESCNVGLKGDPPDHVQDIAKGARLMPRPGLQVHALGAHRSCQDVRSNQETIEAEAGFRTRQRSPTAPEEIRLAASRATSPGWNQDCSDLHNWLQAIV